jgi:hypothetical protein
MGRVKKGIEGKISGGCHGNITMIAAVGDVVVVVVIVVGMVTRRSGRRGR